MAVYTIKDETLTSIADAIREKTGKTDLITPGDMAQEIANISGETLPEETLTVTGNCQYRFSQNGWNDFIEYFNTRIKTSNITDLSYMFYYSTELQDIPFELNCNPNTYRIGFDSLFFQCNKLERVPKINNSKVYRLSNMFQHCHMLREIPDDYCDTWNFSYMDTNTGGNTGERSRIFYNCYSLRSFPRMLLDHAGSRIYNSSAYFYEGFYNCYALDELINLPLPFQSAWTSNSFKSTYSRNYRLKHVTFETNEDGTPKIMQWKSQTIPLNYFVGYVDNNNTYITNYNSGITVDKEVIDDATYQALKNDPDWFTCDIAYSRYNHDSAVETINSLPDTSAYLATAGGTNTIKFTGSAGSSTDGGAINTLTEEEIAVATAKGWTVTLV